MRCFTNFTVGTLLCLTMTAATSLAQRPEPSPPVDEAVRIRTEEVHLTVFAEGAYSGFQPKLRAGDIAVYEDGAEQTITSMRNAPASVMLLLDTGAALTFSKNREVVAMTARVVIESLPEKTAFSILQYNDRTEVIAGWSDRREEAAARIAGSVKSGRRSMLFPAIETAIQTFDSQPPENRHLILVTDGLNAQNAITPSDPAFKQLAAKNIVVHVISYTAIEQKGAEEAGKTVRLNTRPSKPRVPKEIFEDMLRGLPIAEEAKEFLRLQNEAQQILIIDLDLERKKMLRNRRGEWAKAEAGLQELANETGGSISTPVDEVELLTFAARVARSIGSHYDITYTPSRLIAESSAETSRTISVVSRTDAIKVRTRKKLNTAR